MPLATGARTAFEQAILDRQKVLSGGNKNYKISADEYNKVAEEIFGKLADQLPTGAKITRQISPLELEYELNGKTYKAFRNTDSNLGINTGRIQTTQLGSLIDNQSAAGEQDLLKQLLPGLFNTGNGSTPANPQGLYIPGNGVQTLDPRGNVSWLDKLMNNADTLANTKGFVDLDPETLSLLNVIKTNNDAQLSQQFDDQSSDLVASLYGRGINKSNLAGQEANRLLQGQGLVQAQSNADAATRQLQAQQFLTQARQGNLALAGEEYTSGAQQSESNRNSALNFAMKLLDQALEREVSGVQLNQSQQQIDNNMNQFEQNYGLQRDQFEAQAAQQRRANRLQLISSILNGVAGFATGGLSGIASIFKPASSSGGGYTPVGPGE